MAEKAEYIREVKVGDLVEGYDGEIAIVSKIEILNGGNTMLVRIYYPFLNWLYRTLLLWLGYCHYADEDINSLHKIGSIC